MKDNDMENAHPTIKTTFAELRKHGINDWCLLENLPSQGYDEDIVNLMIKYEIFPQTFLVAGQIYISKAAINLVTNKLLRTQMHMYETVETLNEAKAAAIKYLEENKIRLDADDLEAISNGTKTLAQIVDERKQEGVVDAVPEE